MNILYFVVPTINNAAIKIYILLSDKDVKQLIKKKP